MITLGLRRNNDALRYSFHRWNGMIHGDGCRKYLGGKNQSTIFINNLIFTLSTPDVVGVNPEPWLWLSVEAVQRTLRCWGGSTCSEYDGSALAAGNKKIEPHLGLLGRRRAPRGFQALGIPVLEQEALAQTASDVTRAIIHFKAARTWRMRVRIICWAVAVTL